MRERVLALAAAATLILTAAGCDDLEGTGPAGTGADPRAFEAHYFWSAQGWDGQVPTGYPAVFLTWELPRSYRNEPFRIYARRAGGTSYGLIATVTSCANGVCQYTDTNVIGGRSYEYYIVTLDERDHQEIGSSAAVRVEVPSFPVLEIPGSVRATALDQAVFLQWAAVGGQRYLILAQEEGGTRFLIGETDGTSFYDDRARNGVRYTYQVAQADGFGQVSRLSPGVEVIPRPDVQGEIVYAHADRPSASGFRFLDNEAELPILAGDAAGAQWRLQIVGSTLQIQPLGATRITGAIPTTALTCGPGSDARCEDVRVAPAAAAFGSAAVPVEIGATYVLRVQAADGRTHHGKIRALGVSQDGEGRRLMLFDWAYQLRADELRLDRVSD